jgi:hypothetical protein
MDDRRKDGRGAWMASEAAGHNAVLRTIKAFRNCLIAATESFMYSCHDPGRFHKEVLKSVSKKLANTSRLVYC